MLVITLLAVSSLTEATHRTHNDDEVLSRALRNERNTRLTPVIYLCSQHNFPANSNESIPSVHISHLISYHLQFLCSRLLFHMAPTQSCYCGSSNDYCIRVTVRLYLRQRLGLTTAWPICLPVQPHPDSMNALPHER
ncbi:hypothetical protein GQ44DRAFT_424455 [Phaeosphaeriaceae sp. PMI808]|nr:hypothetical protein GQ44DRAFT_424455 [Phaeosphaeriaceae sp. PMI808]